MPETSIESPPGFSELPKAEQVRYLQALWDQISANPDEIPVPESHLHLAEERLRERVVFLLDFLDPDFVVFEAIVTSG